MTKKILKQILLSPWTALITLFLIVGLRIADPQLVESVRLRYFDVLISNKVKTQNNIWTVNIDEEAIKKYGQWPFPRDVYAQIIEELYKRNAGLVVFNILMSEPERNRTGDLFLKKTLIDKPVILPNVPSDVTKNKPKNPGAAILNPEYLDKVISYPGIIANIPDLEESSVGVGIVSTLPEIDGVNRRIPLVVSVDETLYPSLSLETLRTVAGDVSFQIRLNPNGIDALRIPKFGKIDTDNLGRIWIDWSQINHTTSVTELPEDFGGALVIVGTTAAGISNPLPTSIGAVWPHDAQAKVIGTLFNGVNIKRPDWLDGAEIITILTLSLILLFLSRWIYAGINFVLLSASAVIAVSYYGFHKYLWLLDVTAVVSAIILVALHAYGVKFISEYLQKQQIKRQFGTYLSPAMVEKLQKNPDLLKLGGESRELSIMFTDVRGFTSISEHYGADVQGLTKIMNRYMTAMTAKIIENNGTLDKYIGDAQMAFWNAPLDDSNHAKNAVRTALQMMGSLDEFNREIEREGVPPFGMGLGINTDVVVVGNMGSTQRFDYTCLGDGVNLASRLEGQSKPYGVKIVVGPKTAEQIQDEFFVLELDTIAVKGKNVGVTIYTVLEKLAGAADYETGRREHNEMLKEYRSQHFETAIDMCYNLKGEFDGQMNQYYDAWIERCREMKLSKLPRDWDGVYRATSK